MCTVQKESLVFVRFCGPYCKYDRFDAMIEELGTQTHKCALSCVGWHVHLSPPDNLQLNHTNTYNSTHSGGERSRTDQNLAQRYRSNF
jgi:hypothetical protein